MEWFEVGPGGKRLVVVGGGQSCRWLLYALAEQLVRDPGKLGGTHITVVEKQAEWGVGLAWSRRHVLEAHLASRGSLLTRWSYGDRQQRQFAGTVELLRETGSPVTLLTGEEVVDLVEHAKGFELSLASGARLAADYVVLATGYGLAPWGGKAAALHLQTLGSDIGIHTSPWPAQALERLFPLLSRDRILVLGSYLTAIDTVVSLAAHAGRFEARPDGHFVYQAPPGFTVCMASRTGLLPVVSAREASREWTLRHFTATALQARLESTDRGSFLSLHAALRLLGEELALAALEVDGRVPLALQHVSDPARRLRALGRAAVRRDCGERLRADIASVMSTGLPYGTYEQLRSCGWQLPLDRAIALWNEYSPWFCAEDALCFESGLRTVFFNHMLPVTLNSALQLDALLRSGHLRVLTLGRDYRLATGVRGGPRYVLRYGAPASAQEETFDYIVDATGQSFDLEHSRSPLMQAMRRRGTIQPALRAYRHRLTPEARDLCGSSVLEQGGRNYRRCRGIFVNPRTCEAIPEGEVDADFTRARTGGLYAMGPPLAGQFTDSQSIGQAQRDARRIVADL
ncbi:MAG TPA: FAD/NAD(P)-binding protein, partial [Steroidobacteraceae bacterium]